MQERTLILFQNFFAKYFYFPSLWRDKNFNFKFSKKKEASKLFTLACIKLDNVECMSHLTIYGCFRIKYFRISLKALCGGDK